jgi:hypothetical protein
MMIHVSVFSLAVFDSRVMMHKCWDIFEPDSQNGTPADSTNVSPIHVFVELVNGELTALFLPNSLL